MMKIAFVMPWYGPKMPGGAEALGRNLAERLLAAGHDVCVLTTCIRDFFADWGTNFYEPGEDVVNGVPVRRFRVEPRDAATFNKLNGRLMQKRPLSAAQSQQFFEQMIRVPTLFEHIATLRGSDTLFLPLPYLFPTTVQTAKLVPKQTVIIPCLHDEGYAYLPDVRQAMTAAAGLAFLTEAEAKLAAVLYPQEAQPRTVAGCGVQTNVEADGERFRQKFGLTGDFLLYAGRPDFGKNVPLLVNYFQQYQQASGRDLKLVRIGPDKLAATGPNIVDLGFVSVQDKFDAYAAASLFCNPSKNESFSIVMMESWLARRPVLVHADCAPTREHCVKSNGGLYFGSYPEFAATLDYLLERPEVARQMGENGRSYVLQNFGWPQVTANYERLLRQVVQNE